MNRRDLHLCAPAIAACIAAVALLLPAAVGNAAPHQAGVPAQLPAQADDDTPRFLLVGVRSPLPTANISQARVASVREFSHIQYDALTDYSDDTLEIVGELAESWEITDDFTEVTYVLRDGLLWSDGTPLTASDAAYTIERSAAENWPGHASFTNGLSAEAVDERTLIVRSAEPDPTFPALPVAIVPEHIFSQYPTPTELAEWDGTPGVGSGPFVYQGPTNSGGWAMASNESWLGWPEDGPTFTEIRYLVLAGPNAALSLVESGVLDVVDEVSPDFFERLDGGRDIEAVAGFTGAFGELGLNNGASGLGDGHPALTDLRVRQAIAHSIDRRDLTTRALQGLAIPAPLPIFSSEPAWRLPEASADLMGYDPDRSRALLAEAGFVDLDGDGMLEDADGSPFTLRYAQRVVSPFEPLLGNTLANFLGDVGIAVESELFTDESLLDELLAGRFDLYGWRRTPANDPGRTPLFFTCSQVPTADDVNRFNTTNYCNEEFDALYEAQRKEVDRDSRLDMVHKMIQMLHTDVATITLFEEAELQAFRVDEYEGWTQQPAVVGPIINNESSRTYANLRLIPPSSFSGSDLLGGSSEGLGGAFGDADDTDDADDAGDAVATESPDGDGAADVAVDPGPDSDSGSALPLVLGVIAAALAAVVGMFLWRGRGGHEPPGGDAEDADVVSADAD